MTSLTAEAVAGLVATCPFCGGKPKRGTYDLWCDGVEFNRHTMIVLTEKEWNTRALTADQAALSPANQRLVVEVARMRDALVVFAKSADELNDETPDEISIGLSVILTVSEEDYNRILAEWKK